MVKIRPISSDELWMAETALFVAIALQVAVWGIGESLTFGPQLPIIITEVLLAVIIRFSAQRRQTGSGVAHRPITVLLLALISLGNISSFVLVAKHLIMGESVLSGRQLLASAIAIFLTNIIVFALWYWEIDSPGLTGKKWSKHDKDFQFTQRAITADLGKLKPGQSVTKTYLVKVTSETDGDVITNKACFTGDSDANDNPQKGCDVAVVKVTVPETPTPTPTPTPQPTKPETPAPQQPTSLPNTGAGNVIMVGAIVSALGYAAYLLRLKRAAQN